MSKQLFPRGRRQQGVALIEVMVGFIIFAVGVVGLIGLQASMVKATTGAKFRADAVSLAVELEGLMWADAEANLPKYTTSACAGHPPCAEWSEKLKEVLPKGSFKLTPVTSLNRNEEEVVISWEPPGDDVHQFKTEFALPATL